MTTTRFLSLLSIAGALLGAQGAQAALTTYFGENQNPSSLVSGAPVTARTSFLAGLAATVKNENFESFSNLQSGQLDLSFTGSGGSTLGASLIGDGVIYDTPGAGRFNTSPGGTKLYEVTSSFEIDFGNTPISAFGFYGTDIGDFAGRLFLTLTDMGGNVSEVTVVDHSVNVASDGSLLFFGFIDSSTSYRKIVFGNTATGVDIFGFDDMVVGDLGQVTPPGTVAEPASLGLAALSLFGLAAVTRRRKFKSAQ